MCVCVCWDGGRVGGILDKSGIGSPLGLGWGWFLVGSSAGEQHEGLALLNLARAALASFRSGFKKPTLPPFLPQ